MFLFAGPLSFAPQAQGQFCPEDINQDNQVDGADLAMLLSKWGPCQVGPAWATVLEWAPNAAVVTDVALPTRSS
jgi:hypothetical protein